jgi:hypothetical protein
MTSIGFLLRAICNSAPGDARVGGAAVGEVRHG